MENEAVLCKDCVHSFYPWYDFLYSDDLKYKCKKTYKPDSIEPSPVGGTRKVTGGYDMCKYTRMRTGRDGDESCGPDGKWWEPKHKKDLFVYLKRI